jgi:hypothetical protein
MFIIVNLYHFSCLSCAVYRFKENTSTVFYSSNPGGGYLGPGVRLPGVPLLRGELRQAQLAAVPDILQVISAIKKDSRTKLTLTPAYCSAAIF